MGGVNGENTVVSYIVFVVVVFNVVCKGVLHTYMNESCLLGSMFVEK